MKHTQHYQYNNHFLLFHPLTSVTIQENIADSQQNAQGGWHYQTETPLTVDSRPVPKAPIPQRQKLRQSGNDCWMEHNSKHQLVE